MRRVATTFLLGALFCVSPLLAQEIPAEYQQVLTSLGKQGDFKDNVLKVNIPRNDVSGHRRRREDADAVRIRRLDRDDQRHRRMDVMMGDLVLLEDEVNPVMSALLDNGLDVTALHNHFFWDEPRMFYMHVHGTGKPADLAQKVKPALDLIGKGATAGRCAGRGRQRCTGRQRSTPRSSRRSSARRASRTARSTRSRSAATISSDRDGRADQRAHGTEYVGRLFRHRRRTRRSPATSRCSPAK